MKKQVFRAELLDGHKGPAVLVPFDPEQAWGVKPVPVESAAYGTRPGYLVEGTLNGRAFRGWIGNRWGRFFILVDVELQHAARVSVGQTIEVAIAPRKVAKSKAKPRAKKTRASR